MFKVGQRVRVIQWSDMPEELRESWGILTYHIGDMGTITKAKETYCNVNVYELESESLGGWALMVLEPEIEPFVRVGEQLLFDFMTP